MDNQENTAGSSQPISQPSQQPRPEQNITAAKKPHGFANFLKTKGIAIILVIIILFIISNLIAPSTYCNAISGFFCKTPTLTNLGKASFYFSQNTTNTIYNVELACSTGVNASTIPPQTSEFEFLSNIDPAIAASTFAFGQGTGKGSAEGSLVGNWSGSGSSVGFSGVWSGNATGTGIGVINNNSKPVNISFVSDQLNGPFSGSAYATASGTGSMSGIWSWNKFSGTFSGSNISGTWQGKASGSFTGSISGSGNSGGGSGTWQGTGNGTFNGTYLGNYVFGTFELNAKGVLSAGGFQISKNSGPVSGSWSTTSLSGSAVVDIYSPYNTIVFKESGLSNTIWNVTLNGVTEQSSTSTIIFNESKSGNYLYSVGNVIGYVAAPSSGSVSFSPPTPTVVEINFSQLKTLTMHVIGNGTVNPSTGVHIYPYGTKVNISANESTAFLNKTFFSYWYGTGIGSYSGSSKNVTLTMDNNITETAIFGKMGTVTFIEFGLPKTSNIIWNVTLNGVTEQSSTSTIIFNEPVSGNSPLLSHFTVGNVIGYVAVPSNGVVRTPITPESVEINFSPIKIISNKTSTLTMRVIGNGTVNPSTGVHIYPYGTKVGISESAFPNSNYTFYNWSGTGIGSYSGSSKNVTLTMDNNITETAIFAKPNTITIINPNDTNGTQWSITFNGNTTTTTNSFVVFSVSKSGNYSYDILPISGSVPFTAPFPSIVQLSFGQLIASKLPSNTLVNVSNLQCFNINDTLLSSKIGTYPPLYLWIKYTTNNCLPGELNCQTNTKEIAVISAPVKNA
jgi:hypothetical protein